MNQSQTYFFPIPWTVTINENGIKTLWYLIVELGLGNFTGIFNAWENFKKVWERNYEEALNLDYVFSIRPFSKDMPIDETLLKLPKFIKEPFDMEENGERS